MTENEIKIKLEVLKDWVGNVSLTRQDMQNVIDEAIQALEEIQQYRAIGTVKKIKIREAQFERLSEGYLNDLTLLREYEAIGAIEEFKALKEKSVAKKPLNDGMRIPFSYYCPNCKEELSDDGYEPDEEYCCNCGQHILIKN